MTARVFGSNLFLKYLPCLIVPGTYMRIDTLAHDGGSVYNATARQRRR